MSSEKLGKDLLVGWGDGDDNDDDDDDEVVEEQQTLCSNNDSCNDSSSNAYANNNQQHDPTISTTTNNCEDEENATLNETRSIDWNDKQSSTKLGRTNFRMNSFDDTSNDGILTRDEIFGERNNTDDDDDDDDNHNAEHEKGINNDFDDDDDDDDDDEMNVLNTIHVNKKETLIESNNETTIDETNPTSAAPTSSTLWSRFTPFGTKQSTQEEKDHSDKGLLDNEQHEEEDVGGLETNHFEQQQQQESYFENDAKEHKSDDNVSSTSTLNNYINNNNNSDPTKTTPINEMANETPIVMRNAIEGFGSNGHHPQSSEINTNSTSSSSYSGIGGFFRSIQLQRLKAKQQFDPFSLTQEELDILKEDIRSRYDDLQTMDTAIASTNTSSSNAKNTSSTSASVLTGNLGKDKQPGLKEHVQAAILAPEAFSEYVDRLVEDDDGEDNMGVYRTVPLRGDKDIADDYVLRQKEMKPMKMEGDNEVTWSDVAEALQENMVIDEETFMEDLDPQGNYRRILPTFADDDEDEDKTGEKGFETRREMEEMRMQIMKLNGRIQSLEEQLKSKDDEIADWKQKFKRLENKHKTEGSDASKTEEVQVNKVVEENLFKLQDFEATKVE